MRHGGDGDEREPAAEARDSLWGEGESGRADDHPEAPTQPVKDWRARTVFDPSSHTSRDLHLA